MYNIFNTFITDKALSKNALKNKKKREAKAKAKQQEVIGSPLVRIKK